jgi:hypothetical protein
LYKNQKRKKSIFRGAPIKITIEKITEIYCITDNFRKEFAKESKKTHNATTRRQETLQ